MRYIKILLILLFIIIFASSLVACDKKNKDNNNEITVTVVEYLPSSVRVENAHSYYRESYSVSTIKIEKGTRFTKAVLVDYYKSQNKNFGGFGSGEFIGFFTDCDLSKKYNEELPVYDNITVFFERYSMGSANQNCCMLIFNYDGKTYKVAKRFNDLLSVDDFQEGAYGKEINTEGLLFFFDIEQTEEVLFDNKTILDYCDKIYRNGTFFAEIKIYVIQKQNIKSYI